MSPSTVTAAEISDNVDSPHSRSTSLDDVAPKTRTRSSSPSTESTNDDGLDDLFEDETTRGLNLPPIPASSPIASSDDSYAPGPQKRKRDTAAPDDDPDNKSGDSPQPKKAKSDDEEVEQAKDVEADKAARHYHALAVAALKPPSKNNASKLFKSMRKQTHIPVPKYVPTGLERRDEVNMLAAQHVHHVAPTMLANLEANRDISGKMSKFDWADTRREIKKSQIVSPGHRLEKWVDKDDEHITWLVIPASQKYINTGSAMIPISDIVNKSIKYPEFTFVESVMGPHWKTGVDSGDGQGAQGEV